MGVHSSLALWMQYYWPFLRCNITNYVCTCDPCQKIKHNRRAGRIPAALGNTRKTLWYSLPQLHHWIALVEWKGCHSGLTRQVDQFTHFIATTSNINARDTAVLIFKCVVKVFRLLEVIIDNRDPRWISSVWKNLAIIFNSCLVLYTSRHPQTDGQTEVMNQQLETMLQAYGHANQKDWSQWLDVIHILK